MKHKLYLSIILILFFITALSAKNKELVNRRVLVLDFVNQQHNKEASYLEGSIPEAMLDQLKGTGKFTLLSRSDSVAAIKKLGLKKDETFNEANAVAIGREAEADVVVIGQFVAVGDSMQIQAKAVDVHAKRIAVAKTKVGKLDSSMFATIGKLANEMSKEMARKLPPMPLRERVVYRDTCVECSVAAYRDRGKLVSNFRAHALVGTGFALPSPGSFLKTALGAKLDVSFQFLTPLLNPYFETSFYSAAGQKRIQSMSMIHFGAGLSYPIEVAKKLSFIKSMIFSPYVAGGFYTGNITAKYDLIENNISYTVASFDFGLMGDFFLLPQIALTTAFKGAMMFDNNTPLLLLGIDLGVGYKF